MSTPKFSLITISYNHAEFIRKTIDSVLDQKYPNFEHIVIDGGSTDETIQILKSYPHLNWISEPDRGISHALNKGLKKASGDILAWINSDDWYEPGTFEVVSQSLRDNPIVMGNAMEADRAGNPVKLIKNYPRTYFDLLRYWVPKGWLAQPSIFFTKAALESVRLQNGDYIDESYNYSMDYELWLRLGTKYPFTNYVDRVFSHYRIYGENKTGRTFASPQRELGRAFRSSSNRYTNNERKVSFVVATDDISDPFIKTLRCILDQELRDFDLIVVNCSPNKETIKLLKDAVMELEEATTVTNFRFLSVPGTALEEAQKIGIETARSQLIAVLRPGDIVEKDFMHSIVNTFAHDTYGAGFILPPEDPLRKSLANNDAGILDANALLHMEVDFIPFVVRKIVMEELGGYSQSSGSWVTFREFMLRTINHGWLVKADCELNATDLATIPPRKELLLKLRALFCKTHLFATGAKESAQDIFYPIRSESPYAPSYSSDQLNTAENMLKGFPSDWIEFDFSTSIERLQSCVKEMPFFRPAWYLLAVALKNNAREIEAAEVFQEFLRINPDLKNWELL